MKRTRLLYAVTALAALSFASQAFARSGSMGGGQSHGATGGTFQSASTRQAGSGNGSRQHTMQGNGSQQGASAGSMQTQMKQGGTGNSAGRRQGQMNGNDTAPTAQKPPVTTATN